MSTNGVQVKEKKVKAPKQDEMLAELERLRAENDRLRKSRQGGGARQTYRGSGVSLIIRVLTAHGYTQGEINKGLGMAGCWIQSGNTLSTQYQKVQTLQNGKKNDQGDWEVKPDPDAVESLKGELPEETFEILKGFIEGPDDPSEVFGG